MKVLYNSTYFTQNKEPSFKEKNKISNHFDESNKLIRIIETDTFGRDIDAKHFDKEGILISHMHKFYHGDDFIEMYKDNNQEYTRKIYHKIKNGFQHRIEKFVSKTSPKSNYIQEFVKNTSGKLIKIISNGNVIKLK